VDFNKKYAPNGQSAALRTALSVGIKAGMDIHQMDVRNAFLNGKLEEVIYLSCLSGFEAPPGTCLKLHKSIYGIKQATQVWYTKLQAFFDSIAS
jgi:hypothetical protein